MRNIAGIARARGRGQNWIAMPMPNGHGEKIEGFEFDQNAWQKLSTA